MGIANSISRLTEYYKRHGFEATIRRAGLAARRAVFSSRMVVFYCDLAKLTTAPVNIPSSLRVERLRSYSELCRQDLQEMTSFWNPKQANRNIRERFGKGASLWLIKSGEKLAGYGWTLQGHTIEPYYFPLGQDDMHLFDFHVFPEYRGKGINPFLVAHMVDNLAMIGGGRAFIEAAEWNEAQLSSLRKTPFHRLGLARSFAIFGHMFTRWVEDGPDVQARKGAKRRDGAPTMARQHEQ
jgi:ribosomal protein S18 acetylase RimI-like enzyme